MSTSVTHHYSGKSESYSPAYQSVSGKISSLKHITDLYEAVASQKEKVSQYQSDLDVQKDILRERERQLQDALVDLDPEVKHSLQSLFGANLTNEEPTIGGRTR